MSTGLTLKERKHGWHDVIYEDSGETVSHLRCVRAVDRVLTFTCFSDPRLSDEHTLIPEYDPSAHLGMLRLTRKHDGTEIGGLREVSVQSVYDEVQVLLVECTLDEPVGKPVDASYLQAFHDRGYKTDQPKDFEHFGRDPVGSLVVYEDRSIDVELQLRAILNEHAPHYATASQVRNKMPMGDRTSDETVRHLLESISWVYAHERPGGNGERFYQLEWNRSRCREVASDMRYFLRSAGF